MAYEEVSEVSTVQLGGVNKKTGKPNPTELEGYYVGVEQRPNKFNPAQPKNFYKFQTQNGLVGTYASAGIDSALKNAVLGRMTLLISTGEIKDTGKGNPMKVFKAKQDKTNTIDVDNASFASDNSSDEYGSTDTYSEPEEVELTPPARPVAPARAATVPSADRQARIQAMLSNKSRSA